MRETSALRRRDSPPPRSCQVKTCRALPPVGPDLRAGRAPEWPMPGRPEVGPYRPAAPCKNLPHMGQARSLSFLSCLRRKTRSARRKETRRFSKEELRASKTSLSSVCPAFSVCEGSSNKHPIQNLLRASFLRALRVSRREPPVPLLPCPPLLPSSSPPLPRPPPRLPRPLPPPRSPSNLPRDIKENIAVPLTFPSLSPPAFHPPPPVCPPPGTGPASGRAGSPLPAVRKG